MPVQVTSLDKVPQAPSRTHRKRVLEKTEEWLQVRTKLAAGLELDEALTVTFTADRRRQLGLKSLGRSFRDMVRRYCQALGMKIEVWRWHANGTEYIIAVREPHVCTDTKEVSCCCALFE